MNEESPVHEKAERIRDVIRYIRRFKNALVIIYLDDVLLDSPLFPNHIKDICLTHEAGLKVVLVPGARKRIDEILLSAGIPWSHHESCRITAPDAMPLIKMAAFDVSNQIMTALAGEKKTAVIGNWVRARGKGIINGFDYGPAGEIDRLQMDAVRTVLESGFIPIFPCIGWSVAGKPYNISSVQLAQQIAACLQADKLFYLVPGAAITTGSFTIPEHIGLSPEGTVPAMNLDELQDFLEANERSAVPADSREKTNEQSLVSVPRERIVQLLRLAEKACNAGVNRVHLLDGSLDGTLPCEIFSDLGSGTMIYASNYGKIRDMTREDIPAVLNVMRPFIRAGNLLPRTKQSLAEQYMHYIVYELDGAIRACAALIPYGDGQMEIAGIAVEKTCSHIGIGPKLMEFLVNRARQKQAKSVFLLTTQTADWFENLGFKETEIASLPEKRKQEWSPQRGSKALRLAL